MSQPSSLLDSPQNSPHNGAAHDSNGKSVTIAVPDEISSSEIAATEIAATETAATETAARFSSGSGHTGWTPGFRAQNRPEKALKFVRRYTKAGQDPFETSEWERRTAAITGETGKSVFEQKDCEIPKAWSQLATNVVVSKYFRGPMNSPQRETSVRQVIGRVSDTIGGWGREGGYFASDEDASAFRDELTYLLLHQYGAFNSPVWFNLGVKGAKAQASACQPYDALVSTPAGLIPIGELVEKNSVGTPVFDAHGVARIVATKANGVKNVLRIHTQAGYTLDVTADHLVWQVTGQKSGKWVEAGTLAAGDVLQWHRTPVIDKAQELGADVMEAALAGWLQSDGFVGRYEGTNHSLTIEAMTVNADEEAWVRAALQAIFPGAHSHTRTVETQDESLDCQRIRVYGEFLSPFVAKWGLLSRRHEMRVPGALYTAPLPVAAAYLRSLFQAEGYVSVRENAVIGLDMMGEEMMRGVQKLLLRFGIYSRLRRKEDARENRAGMWSLAIRTLGDREQFQTEIGFVGVLKTEKLAQSLELKGLRLAGPKKMQIERIETRGEMPVFDIQTTSGEYLSGGIRVHNCFINSVYDDMESIMELAATEARLFKGGSGAGTNLWRVRSSKEQLSGGGIASGPVSFMRGWDAFAGAIKCLTPDAMVYTQHGLQRLDEVIDTKLEPGFHPDDSLVLATKDGPTRISQVYLSPKAPTLRAQLCHTGLRLRGTHSHPVMTLSPEFRLEWKALCDLQIGDRVAVSRRTEMWPDHAPRFDFAPQLTYAKKEFTYPAAMTPELARLLGYMTSEGCMDAERFRFCNADPEVFADFLRCVEATFGVEPTRNVSQRAHPQTGVATQMFEACWPNAVRFFEHVGLLCATSAHKSVPRSIRQSPRALVAEFLRAYFEGDGHVSTHIYASSASRLLLEEIQLLLLNMGLLPLLRFHPVNGQAYWSLYLRGEAAFGFAREIGFVSERKSAAAERLGDKNLNTNIDTVPFLVDALRSRTNGNAHFQCADGSRRALGFGFFNRKIGSEISYARLKNTPNLRAQLALVEPEWASTLDAILEGEWFWDKVHSIEAAPEALTYDFTVPGTHSFVAQGIVNHNSGGTTRRAAKMVVLNADHPDIEEFITCKSTEEKKAWALIEMGYNGGWNVPGGAYDSVMFQNANHSVRVSDEFMRAAEAGEKWQTKAVTSGKVVETKNARDMLKQIAECTHLCGDPGLQFDSIINDWHTCAGTDRIYASNPCCVTGDTLVAVADGRNAVAIRDLVGSETPVYAHDHATNRTTISRMWNIGVKRENARVYRVTLDDGSTFRATDDHLIMLRDGSYKMVRDLAAGQSLMPFHSKVLAPQKNRTKRRQIWNGHTWTPQYRAIWEYNHGKQPLGNHIHHADFRALNDAIENLVLMSENAHNALHAAQMLGGANPARRGMNDEWRAAISRAMSGDGNPNFGKTHSPETREKMRARAAARWQNSEQRARASQSAKSWIAEAQSEGRKVGRTPKETFERACPVCRAAFETRRVEQIFCGSPCRNSPMGYAMSGGKGGQTRAGQTQTSEISRRAALVGHQHAILKSARLLMDNGHAPTLENWADLRSQLLEMGVSRAPKAATVARYFEDSSQLQDAAAHFNHKVASVEFCGLEDVYDGTVDTHHNFAILTSSESSCATGEQNFSGIFIHNSEFVFLDDTACNLSSLNLLKFYDFETGYFDAEAYVHACEVFLTAQEIIVSFASYPTEKIAENSELYRPLGLGYCNIGALLMAMGLAYDSDQGRAFAGALTAIMTGSAYAQSARIAANVGPFEGYAKNKEPMLRVIGKHRDSVKRIDEKLVAENVMTTAQKVWDDALMLGQKHGYRNAQTTVLAPTGTISFMMDADTTGIEPDIALVKYKKLVGGGLLKIVNQTVPAALRKLSYNEDEIKSIVDYIDKNDTIEGAPGILPEHLSVFDCAFKAMNGTRSIHHMGHIKMMAAAQPFLSGAISKTVNMPESCTVEEIMDAYLQSWKLGTKAVAIYRDNSKRTQPLSTASDAQKADKADKKEAEASASAKRALRRKLPDERQSVTHKFSIAGQEGYFMVGLYPDGSPGELFIKMSKEGSTISGLMDSFAVSISLCLQYGVPLRVLVNKFSHTRFEPSGYTTNREIPIAKSLMDYIFRWFDLKFHPNGDNGHFGKPSPAAEIESNPELSLAISSVQTTLSPAHQTGAENGNLADAQASLMQSQTDAPPCPNCGAITVRSGSCYKCNECGTTTGCG